MLSDADIADQLDEILTNPESEDEFMDEIDHEYDDDETVSQGVQRAKKNTVAYSKFQIESGVQKHEFNLHKNSSILEFFEAFVSEFLIGKACNDVNIGELYVFIATTLLMARNKKFILKMIYFCNNENRVSGNRLFKLDMVLDEVKANFKAAMVPFQNLVIDESLVLWKGRLSFKQFIKSKHYILDFIYTEAETRLIPYDQNIGVYGGVYLLKKKTTLTGTVKKNRRGMPPLKNKLAVGGVQSSHTKNRMVLKWLDKREVFMLSTLFNNKLADSGKVDKNGINIKKPKCIVNYNACMGSIEKTDMLLSSVEPCLLNAFSIYKTVTGKSMSLANFQLEVIRQLLEKYSTSTESPNRGRPSTKDQPLRLSVVEKQTEEGVQFVSKTVKEQILVNENILGLINSALKGLRSISLVFIIVQWPIPKIIS
ncbi:hypothetical protein QTP88_001630 [Uroleucon formosanum]